jgi:hypothetical protein
MKRVKTDPKAGKVKTTAKQTANTYINKVVQSHDPPSPEMGTDKRYYEHVMKDFYEQYNCMNKRTVTIISCTQTLALPITTTPAHEYKAQTVAGVSEVLSPVKMNINVLTKIF